MKYTQKYIAIILIVVFAGGIFYAEQNGYWQTETSKTPEKMIVEGQEVYNPEDIRGSYSFEDVSNAFDVPIDVLIDAFQLPEGTDGSVFKNKDLEELYGELAGDNGELGNGSVKIFVAFYKNIPMELEEGNLILEKGAEILRNLGTLTEEQMEYLDRNTMSSDKSELGITDSMGEVEPIEEVEPVKEINEDEDHEEFKINGNVTFKEIEDVGINMEEVEEILGMPVDNKALTVKDFCSANELSFSEIKTKLTEIYENLEIEPQVEETSSEIKNTPVEIDETSIEPPLVQSIYSDGKYTGTGTGYRSGLEVEVEIKNGEIYNIEVVKEREDE